MKKKIGITGQSGFIGWHLLQNIYFQKERYDVVTFYDEYFKDPMLLGNFVNECDVLVHLAGVNRHESQEELYRLNLDLTESLLVALRKCNHKINLIFASSIQEKMDNLYGKSKLHSRKKFEDWAFETNNCFNVLIIPNVFGPFCRPQYNSVVATFCNKLALKESPEIKIETELRLIYVGSLVKKILSINDQNKPGEVEITPELTISVSSLLQKLQHFAAVYFDHGEIPELQSMPDINLFNTLRSYLNYEDIYPYRYQPNVDQRGMFVEIVKTGSKGQMSYSTTRPGITRGNHFHTRKIERFAVIKGEARINMRKVSTEDRVSFELNGDNPSFVDMPVWYTHNIINIGKSDLITLFWSNEAFNPNDTDTYFEEV